MNVSLEQVAEAGKRVLGKNRADSAAIFRRKTAGVPAYKLATQRRVAGAEGGSGRGQDL